MTTSSNLENQVYMETSYFNKDAVNYNIKVENTKTLTSCVSSEAPLTDDSFQNTVTHPENISVENAEAASKNGYIENSKTPPQNVTESIETSLENASFAQDSKNSVVQISELKIFPKRIKLTFSPQKSDPNNLENVQFRPMDLRTKLTTKSKTQQKPRWHTQTNIMFMALRSMPDQESSRRELITEALKLDENFHKTRNLPRAFTGKTPRNSASACLTTNPHKYFKHFYKPGLRQMFFRLTYKPCDLEAAIKEYDDWMNILIEKDWPKCFQKAISDPSNLPKKWQDVLEIKTSTLKNAGKGLFAKIKIPKSTPIGFYFGVPTMEDEYDILKDHVGLASKYSIMYRQTVLDATDANGMPFTDVDGPIYCPFHFANEDLSRINITFLEGTVVNQVIVSTLKTIEAGQELFVNYGAEVDRSDWINTPNNEECDFPCSSEIANAQPSNTGCEKVDKVSRQDSDVPHKQNNTEDKEESPGPTEDELSLVLELA